MLESGQGPDSSKCHRREEASLLRPPLRSLCDAVALVAALIFTGSHVLIPMKL